MSKKIFLILLTIFLLLVPFAFAQKPEDWEPPEKNGVYDVPGKKNLKVRVFVHNPKPEPTSSPLLTCNDPDSSAVVPSAGWKLPSSVTYHLNPSSAPPSVDSNLSTIAANAFSTWAKAIPGKVSFVQGSDTSVDQKRLDNQNIIAWGRISGNALAVTYTWYNTTTKEVVETDTIFNKKFIWSWTPYSVGACGIPNTYDTQDILTHELGHWMGLDDVYSTSYVENTMYGYGAKGEIKKDTLTKGDIDGVNLIYK